MKMFQKAVKTKSKLRLSIAGPSGSGKTYTALAIAKGIGKTALIDTESGSASKYADTFDFDVLELTPPFHPDKFIRAIAEASAAGYDVVIVDSLSHAWSGSGGLLEIVDDTAKRMKSSNSFAAWKDATPIQNRLVEAVVRSGIHIIATLRSKTEYILEQQTSSNGRTINVPRKIGMAPVQRDGFEYEFDVVAELDHDHNFVVTKTRCAAIDNLVVNKAGDNVSTILLNWLNSGEAVASPAPAEPSQPAPANPAGIPTEATDFLEYVNGKVDVKYSNIFHLLNAIKQTAPKFTWDALKTGQAAAEKAFNIAVEHAANKKAESLTGTLFPIDDRQDAAQL
jgi:DNA polymerase III delta prime subunit